MRAVLQFLRPRTEVGRGVFVCCQLSASETTTSHGGTEGYGMDSRKGAEKVEQSSRNNGRASAHPVKRWTGNAERPQRKKQNPATGPRGRDCHQRVTKKGGGGELIARHSAAWSCCCIPSLVVGIPWTPAGWHEAEHAQKLQLHHS
jgi:hypothetical protein